MTPDARTIAQAGKLVRLRALRRDVAARALARARAALAEAEAAVMQAIAACDAAEATHRTARAALCDCRGAVALYLEHVAGCLAMLVQARGTLGETEAARDTAAEVAKTAARALARLTARHDQLAGRHRAMRRHHARATEARIADQAEHKARAA